MFVKAIRCSNEETSVDASDKPVHELTYEA